MDKQKFLVALIVIGALAGLVVAKNRFHIEEHNRRVETVVDYADAYNLAIASRTPLAKTLAVLRRSGIVSIVVSEDPIDSIRVMGAMSVLAVSPTETDLTFSPSFPGQDERVLSALSHKTSLTYHQDGDTLIVDAPYNQFSSIGAGLNPVEVKNSLAAGFFICPRIYNYPGVTPAAIDWMLERASRQCAKVYDGKTYSYATTVIFNGADVVGNRNEIDETASALAANNLNYGSIEFGKQIGDEDLSAKAEDSMVRVHSIGGAEMPTMDEDTALGRYILGARERNIRVLYIRLFQNGIFPEPKSRDLPAELDNLPEPLEANARFLWEVRDGLKEGGLHLGPSRPFTETDEPIPAGAKGKILLVLLGLGAAAGGVLLVTTFTGLSGRGLTILLVVSLLIGAVLALPKHTLMGRQILALVAAIALPSVGLATLRVPEVRPGKYSILMALELAFRRYVVASAWTVLGVVLVVGLLADRIFMLHIDGFEGIRIAVIAPMILTLIYHGLGMGTLPLDASWETRKRRIGERWIEFTSSPLLVGQTMAGMVALAIVAVIVLRSGNDPGVGVSGAEMSFRSILNKVLFVRPRTKEFLFGHPFMVAGLAAAFMGNRKYLTLFLAAGAIGQASLLNTFCHIHTPILFSFVRAMLGWIIGAILGAFVFAVIRLAIERNAVKASQLRTA